MPCQPKYRKRDGRSIRSHAASYQYTPLQIAAAYGAPAGLDGSGQTIGLIELGGAFSQQDLSTYLAELKLPDVQAAIINVAGGSMQPDPGGADVEVMLDACIAAAIAPRARLRVYFAPNSDQGFAAAIAQAASECDVVSISWGGPESQWSASGRALMDRAFQSAVAANVCCYAAAGDNGASDGTNQLTPDYPASSPWCVGVGGTSLILSGSSTSIVRETVWNDGSQGGATGGGFSAVYGCPNYQVGVPGSRRGVPDVAAVADPETGWIIRANGQDQVVGGTSAAAPFWAALHCLLNQAAGKRLGFLPLLLYPNPSVCRDVTQGNNAGETAGPGWDACTGLGSPNGASLLALVQGTQPAPGPTPSPTPVPTPTPAPVPSGLEAIVQAAVDGIFAQVLAKEAGHPLIQRLLRMLQSAVDVELQKVFASGAHTSGIVSQIVAALVNAAFKAVEARIAGWPLLVAALEQIKPTVEQAVLDTLSKVA